jgi:2-oxoglutarate ferredoxin oxidoreductase subunit beta
MNVVTSAEKLTAKDFATDQEVRWCPGCGDYAILKAMQKALPELGVTKEGTVFVSGIGCAARFPYYMETYGFHTIHGRAPAVATGLKLAQPDLDVWVVSGDGDALSIGGNHLMHVLRRNVDLNILLFNNRIYGLTKGQYSPTSAPGTKSPSTPVGSVENPISAGVFALGAAARFVARGIDTQSKQLVELFKRAHGHKGASFVEILQNCIVYADNVHKHITDKSIAKDSQILLENGKPLIFGKDNKKGIRIKPGTVELEIVIIGENGVTEDDLLVHDETNRTVANMLVAMDPPTMPVAIGVIYCDATISYEQSVVDQINYAQEQKGEGKDLNVLLRSGSTWEVL